MGAKLQPQDAMFLQRCKDFSDAVERLVAISNKQADLREAQSGCTTVRMTYLDAIMETARKFNLEPDLAAAYVNSEIKEKLQTECEQRRMIPKTAKLFQSVGNARKVSSQLSVVSATNSSQNIPTTSKMNGYDTCKLYTALNNHFFSASYDYFQYGGEVALKVTTYEAKTPPVKFMFDKLGRKFYEKEELENYLVANLIGRQKRIGFIGEVLGEEAARIYREWLGHTQSCAYIFSSEMKRVLQEADSFNQVFSVTDGQHPEIFKAAVRGDVSIETFALLNVVLNFVPNFDVHLGDDGSWSTFRQKVVRYAPFLQRLNIDVVSLRSVLRTLVQD